MAPTAIIPAGIAPAEALSAGMLASQPRSIQSLSTRTLSAA
jgi:hypothetical protein